MPTVHRLDATRHREFIASGLVNAYTREPLRAGDEVVICAYVPCGAVWSPATWRAKGNQCPACKSSDSLAEIGGTSEPVRFGSAARWNQSTSSGSASTFRIERDVSPARPSASAIHPGLVAGIVIAAILVLFIASQSGGPEPTAEPTVTSTSPVAPTPPPRTTPQRPSRPAPTQPAPTPPPPAQPESTLTALDVEIHSVPPGASVRIDGRFIGTAPVTASFSGADIARRHVVSLGGERFDTTSYQFVPGELRQPELRLAARPATPAAPRTGSLAIQLPTALEVFVDGRSLGAGATFRTELSPGDHRIEFVGAGMFIPQRDIRIRAGESHTVTIGRLESVRLIARPANCEVWIAGRRYDVTPTTFTAPEGYYQLEFRWPALSRTQTVSLQMPAASNPIVVAAPH